MPLPTCQCNAGLPTQQQLGNIYCALLEIASGSGGGFTPPLLPSLGGTGVSNLDAETITLNGGFPMAFTLTGATGLTLPTTGTLATLAGNETLSNKTLTGPVTVNGDIAVTGLINNSAGAIITNNLQFSTVGVGADSPAPDGTYTPVTSITISNGVITAIS